MKKTSILIISVFIMAILTACGSSADNSQKQETIVKQPEATSMTVESDGNIKCLSPAKKYKLYKSSINKSIHFVQRKVI